MDAVSHIMELFNASLLCLLATWLASRSLLSSLAGRFSASFLIWFCVDINMSFLLFQAFMLAFLSKVDKLEGSLPAC